MIAKRIIYEYKEIIILDDFSNIGWESHKEFMGRGYIWFIITPANFKYLKISYNLEIDKIQLSNDIIDKLDYLKQNKENIQLALFLGKIGKFLLKEEQEKKIREAVAFLNRQNIHPNKLYLIDRVFNEYTKFLAKKLGFKTIIYTDFYINPFLKKILGFLSIKKTIIQNIYRFFKKRKFQNIFFLILSEFLEEKKKTIHVEALVREDLWNRMKNLVGKNYTWYVITPTNYDYCKTYFNLKCDREEFERVLRKRIKYLIVNGVDLQLHIHLGKNRKKIPKEFQKVKFHEAFQFFKSLGITPTKFAAGWWNFNSYTLKLVKKYGIKEISSFSLNPFQADKVIDGIKIRFVHKYWHDFDFV
jgi:hypothetical protein